jgi:hypothetical protein
VARIVLIVLSAAATVACGESKGGWQRLWTDRWEWHHHSSDWVRGVSGSELQLEVTESGARLRSEIVGLGPTPAVIEVAGRAAFTLRVAPGERIFLDTPIDPGSYSVSIPAFAVMGSPRLGVPVASPRLLVLILVDTLRDDHVNPQRMPGVTSAFAQGCRWRDVTANCSWTLPSVASLFTSRQVLDLSSPEGDLVGIPEGVATWAEVLDRAGFVGAGVVANYTVHALNGFASGFSTYLVPDGHGKEEDPAATWVVTEGRRWLAAHQGEDAFLYLHLMDPHHPYRSWDDPSLISPAIKPLAARQREATTEEQSLLRRLYAGEVEHVDRVLTPFLAELPTWAIVAFTSDHGEALGEHGAWGHGLNLYQEALRVPLLIRGPGVPAGDVGEPTQLLNLAPTLLDLVGVAPPAEMVGSALWDDVPAVPTVSTTFGGGPLRWSWRDGSVGPWREGRHGDAGGTTASRRRVSLRPGRGSRRRPTWCGPSRAAAAGGARLRRNRRAARAGFAGPGAGAARPGGRLLARERSARRHSRMGRRPDGCRSLGRPRPDSLLRWLPNLRRRAPRHAAAGLDRHAHRAAPAGAALTAS